MGLARNKEAQKHEGLRRQKRPEKKKVEFSIYEDCACLEVYHTVDGSEIR